MVGALVEAIDVPLNVMSGLDSPNIAQLARLGVARVSLGSGVAQAAYETARRAATEPMTPGTYESLAQSVDYRELISSMYWLVWAQSLGPQETVIKLDLFAAASEKFAHQPRLRANRFRMTPTQRIKPASVRPTPINHPDKP